MATEEIRQRARDEPDIDAVKTNESNINKGGGGRRPRRSGMARRGVRSLVVAVAVPVSLHLATITMFMSAHRALTKPTWFPSPWILRAIFVGSASIMGLCSWLVWAEGGFHRRPMSLGLLLGYLVLSLTWDPIVFGAGAIWVGLLESVAMFGALIGCSRAFKEVNPIAGDLVKLCIIWAGFVISLNLKLLYW